ncbi:hypothetical protein ACKF11_13615 [Methylobacillus sp. Pita2]|uniref:hypothetical protein n=1 Tax=Methylobacillus sp. Pita2 TaxID=3383245 RepID=UPI0038B54C7E
MTQPTSTKRKVGKALLWILGIYLGATTLHFIDHRHARVAEEKIVDEMIATNGRFDAMVMSFMKERAALDACNLDLGMDAYRTCIHRLAGRVENPADALEVGYMAREWMHHFGSDEQMSQDFKIAVQRGREILEANKGVLNAGDNYRLELNKTWTSRLLGKTEEIPNVYATSFLKLRRLETERFENLQSTIGIPQ